MGHNEQVRQLAFDAPVAVTTTSKIINIENCKRVTLQLIRANHTSGTTVFTVLVSNDETNFVAFNKLIDNVTNTNAQTLTRVASSSLGSNTSKMYDMDLQHSVFKFMKIVATITTDGDGQCVIQKERQL